MTRLDSVWEFKGWERSQRFFSLSMTHGCNHRLLIFFCQVDRPAPNDLILTRALFPLLFSLSFLLAPTTPRKTLGSFYFSYLQLWIKTIPGVCQRERKRSTFYNNLSQFFRGVTQKRWFRFITEQFVVCTKKKKHSMFIQGRAGIAEQKIGVGVVDLLDTG